MKNKYFPAQLKRGARAYPGVLIITLLTLAAIILASVYSVRSIRSDESRSKVIIGLVNNSGEPLFNLGLMALGTVDDTIGAVDLVQMSGDEAEKKMINGDISGYVVIPRGYISKIQSGKNEPATIYLPPATANLASFLTRELTTLFSDIVTETQTAIYSMQDAVKSEGVHVNMNVVLADINMLFFNKVTGRNDYYELRLLGGTDAVPVAVYYVCAAILLLILLWGVAYCRMFINRKYALCRLLASRGTGAFLQIICEYAVFVIFTFLTALMFSAAAGIVFRFVHTGIDVLDRTNVLRCMLFAFRLIPVILAIEAMQLLIYEAASGTVTPVLAQFIALLGCGYLSGLFYPAYFFPGPMRAVGSFLPTGAGLAYLQSCLSGSFDARACLMLAAYAVIFILASAGARRMRMEGGSV